MLFLNWFRLYCLCYWKKKCFLFVISWKGEMFPCVFSFFLFLSSQKNSCIFFLFLTFFVELFTFFQTNSIGKTSCVFVYRSLFLSMFFFHLFFHVVFCLIFLISWATCFLLFYFFASLFPPCVHPLSICSLFLFPFVFSFLSPFSPFLNFLFFCSVYSLYVFLCQTLCATTKRYLFRLLQKLSFSVFSIKKIGFLCFLFCWAFLH